MSGRCALALDTPTRDGLLAYGALGLPLAFAALPIYVHVPKLYADGLGLPLAAVGVVLLAVRVVDALTDPLLGWASDRWASRPQWVLAALPALALGLIALLAPPAGAGLVWLALALVAVTLAWSAASIAYHAWGAELQAGTHERTRVTAVREGFALAGVMLAAALPSMLAADEVAGLARLAWLFPLLLALFAGWTLLRAPRTPRQPVRQALFAGLVAALAHRPFRRLLTVFAANGIAAAIPSVCVLFFVADVLQAPSYAGLFLMLYFAAGAASLPAWVALAARVGKRRAWGVAMALAMAVFVWAWTLAGGQTVAFALICLLSGAALGADLALPPAMLADQLARYGGGGASPAGAWFGWWNLVTKANLALAAGLALPLLGWLGYQPGAREAAALDALAAVYALLPVLLKGGALALLLAWRGDLESEGEMQ
ncbi:MFS transporter [Pseudothauera hydrothermalis]|uniref:MFS transporter n=1 Tax=Pseudothauera hydrothermalis TaxID=2184083 RepID=UPI000E08F2DA|nr:MFS transporter [Pseudothauera hydrothermalis]